MGLTEMIQRDVLLARPRPFKPGLALKMCEYKLVVVKGAGRSPDEHDVTLWKGGNPLASLKARNWGELFIRGQSHWRPHTERIIWLYYVALHAPVPTYWHGMDFPHYLRKDPTLGPVTDAPEMCFQLGLQWARYVYGASTVATILYDSDFQPVVEVSGRALAGPVAPIRYSLASSKVGVVLRNKEVAQRWVAAKVGGYYAEVEMLTRVEDLF